MALKDSIWRRVSGHGVPREEPTTVFVCLPSRSMFFVLISEPAYMPRVIVSPGVMIDQCDGSVDIKVTKKMDTLNTHKEYYRELGDYLQWLTRGGATLWVEIDLCELSEDETKGFNRGMKLINSHEGILAAD